jgi:hypothetical protein
MKYTIKYKFEAGQSFPFVALAYQNEKYISNDNSSESYADAKERLLVALAKAETAEAPPPDEEIEI